MFRKTVAAGRAGATLRRQASFTWANFWITI
jgi:hypothetical protein